MNRSQYSLNEKLAAYFVKHAGEWLTMEQLAAVAGIGGWRTRLNEIIREGMPIEKRARWIERDGKAVQVFDRRYVPPVETAPAVGHDLNEWGLR